MRALVTAWLDTLALPAGLDTDDLAVIVMGTITGIHQQWRIAPETVDLDRVYATLRTVLAGAFGHPAR
ncbi:MAG TPA: hypothetical protein VHJ17_24080 [Thermomonospora sp.]|nr:hypothetical protein [Thermomonospora sp.]